ncbi:MAG: Flp pilus assembly complex ATPase component TadA [Clostridia bacterium]|nr:Flp pilus assembly complex ATPase component TadA [Clostridia bacterium]
MDKAKISYILSLLPKNIAAAAKKPILMGASVDEIRLRVNKPVMVTVSGKSLYLSEDGQISYLSEKPLICDSTALHETFLRLCDNSVFSHTEELSEGFISVKGGFRAGVCGDFSCGALPEVTSVNIRVAREVRGCSTPLFTAFCGGMLIAGPPGCGKTTILRDLIRSLSEVGYRVSVIDSRREISGGTGDFSFDLGGNTDVIFSSDKVRGVQMALRSMYPQIIAFDEVGKSEEIKSVLEAFNSGAHILTTSHAGNVFELRARPVTRKLLDSGVLKTVVIMPKNIGGEMKIYSIEEVLNAVSF